jgi:nucleotide-binding universal stress UspA family protein
VDIESDDDAASRWTATYLAGAGAPSVVIVSRERTPATIDRIEATGGTVVWVPPGWTPGGGPIVAATGHDQASDAAIAPAIDLARRGSGALVLVHVWAMPALGVVELPPDPWGIGSIPDGQSAAVAALAERLQSTVGDVTITAVVRQGAHVARELIAASTGADAIVVGRARPHGSRAVLGAVARGLLELSTCPVVILQHPAAGKDLRP